MGESILGRKNLSLPTQLSWVVSQANVDEWKYIGKIGLALFLFHISYFVVTVHANDFEVAPQVVDTEGQDSFFSPNADGTQDELEIVFVMDGTTGEYQIVIDVHGPGGVGQPDNKFDADDDWSVLGKFGPGLTVNDDLKRIHIEWDGRDSNSKLVADGTYQLQLQIDFFQDELLNPTRTDHTRTFSITVDTQPPQVSPQVTRSEFSPNSDGSRDTLTLNYTLDETLSELQLLIPSHPTVQLSNLAAGGHTLNWDGKNGLGMVLPDGSYPLQLQGTDLAGNQSTTVVDTVQVDTEKPTITQSSPIANANLNTPVSELSAIFGSDTGSQIDFDQSTITVKDANGIFQAGTSRQDGNTLVQILDNQLDLVSENGTYTVTIKGFDLAGNSNTSTLSFAFDTRQPVVSQVRLDNIVFVGPSNINSTVSSVEADLADNGVSGLDLVNSAIQLSRAGTVVNGILAQVDADTIHLQLDSALQTNGTDDGQYQIAVNVADMAGNVHQQTTTFIYDTQPPELTSTSPFNFSLDKLRVDQSLTAITATFTDQNGSAIISGIDAEATKISVSKSDGSMVPAILQVDSASSTEPQNIELRFESRLPSGDYIFSAAAVDLTGNKQQTIEYPFYVDLQTPEIQLDPSDTSIVSLTTVSAQILNYAGLGLDMEKSSLVVNDASGNTVNAKELEKTDQNLVWRIAAPLPGDGSKDGIYTTVATFTDLEGHNYKQETKLTVDTIGPTLTSTTPAKDAKVSTLSDITITLSDNLSGIDFSQTQVTLASPAENVSATSTDNGANQIQLTFTALPTDGTADGLYLIEITATDLAGNTSGTQQIPFYYITQLPEVISISPEASIAINHLTTVSATLLDRSGKGIDFDQTTISVTNSDGKIIDGTTTHTDLVLTLNGLSLPTDGSADGIYTMSIKVVDKLGSTATDSRQIRYDTQPPTIDSSTATETKTLYQKLSNNQVAVTFSIVDQGSGFDISASSFQLFNSDGVAVQGQAVYDGSGKASYNSAELESNGIYALQVALADTAGNTGVPQTFYYTYGIEPAQVVDVSPRITNNLESILVTLKSQQNIDFSQTTFDVKNPANQTIAGIVTNDGQQQMTFTPGQSLSRDGSQDGNYALSILPAVEMIGHYSEVWTGSIIFDTQPPSVSSVTYPTNSDGAGGTGIDLQGQIIGLPTTYTVTLNDASFGSRVDSQQTSVQLVSPSGQLSTTQDFQHNTETGEDVVTLTLNSQPKLDNSIDGDYYVEVVAVDMAGNSTTYRRQFSVVWTSDVQPPVVTSVVYLTSSEPTVTKANLQGQIIGLPTTYTVTLTDAGSGSGVDDQQTSVQLVSPSGQLSVTQDFQHNAETGEDVVTLTLNSQPKSDNSIDGDYYVEVVAADMAGNSTTYRRQFSVTWRSATVTITQPAQYSKVNNLQQVSVTIENMSEAEIENQAQVRLIAPDQTEVAGRQEYSGTTASWFLSQPLPQDGSVDGEYTIQVVVAKDKQQILSYESQFTYDTKSPQVSSVSVATKKPTSLIAGRIVEITEAFSSITVKLTDVPTQTSTGVDLVGSSVSLQTNQGLEIGMEMESSGVMEVENNGVDTITAKFSEIQLTGLYTLAVTPKDLAGNTGHTSLYQISLDLFEPEVTSIKIAERLSNIVADLTDADAKHSTVEVAGANGAVMGKTTRLKPNQIGWAPTNLTNDGTDDGNYTVTITPTNNRGISGPPSVQKFILDTQQPEITSTTIVNLTQPISYLSNPTAQIMVAVVDHGPAGLDMEKQKIVLHDSGDKAISAFLTHDSAQNLYFTFNPPFSKDGTNDGRYKLIIDLTDKAGNKAVVNHLVIYDTQAPTLATITPKDGSLIKETVTEVAVNLEDDGDSGIDFDQTTLTLTDTDGNQIQGQMSHDGKSKLVFQINDLTSSGSYLIHLETADRAGNQASFESGFISLSNLLVAASTTPLTRPAEKAFSRQELDVVSIKLPADVGAHLSTLHLESEGGQVVMGYQDGDGASNLQYRLKEPLKDDGSDDGVYTIVFTPISANGQKGQPQLMSFTHDTVTPEIDETQVLLNVAQLGSNNSLIAIQFPVTDPSPGSDIDWSERPLPIAIELKTTDNKSVSGRTTVDSATGVVTFHLNAPLASDGSQDGKYQLKITVEDLAGNKLAWDYEFDYDTRPPVIQTADLQINGQLLIVDANHEDYPSVAGRGGSVVISAKMADADGLGVNLARSTISVLSPQENPVAGSLIQNGIDQLTFSSSELLSAQGYYKVLITSVGLDPQNLGFQPSTTIGTEFLYETVPPIAHITDDGDDEMEEGEALVMKGTASDLASEQIPASGVNRVEIVGTGPDGKEIEPALATDESEGGSDEWSSWEIEYLPPKSGKYVLSVRVYDKAGNAETYGKREATFTVSLGFKGSTFCWPNPVSLGGKVRISFDPNVASSETVDLKFSVYDLSGDLIYLRKYKNVSSGRKDTAIEWNLRNSSGTEVAKGIYLFRLEILNNADETANTVGKILVVE